MIELSKKKINIADHILTQTYPLIKDAKLLLTVIENIFLGLSYSMTSLLHHEKFLKRLPEFSEEFAEKLALFIRKCVQQHNLRKEYVQLIQNLREVLIARKKSPVEFLRKDRLVICTDEYKLTTISFEQARGYLNLAKEFINNVESIIGKEESLLAK